jgi:hypothetical protein
MAGTARGNGLHPPRDAGSGHVAGRATFHLCIPLGYPAEGARFGGSRRRPIRETTYLDHWGAPVPWTWTRADRAIAPVGAARDEA